MIDPDKVKKQQVAMISIHIMREALDIKRNALSTAPPLLSLCGDIIEGKTDSRTYVNPTMRAIVMDTLIEWFIGDLQTFLDNESRFDH